MRKETIASMQEQGKKVVLWDVTKGCNLRCVHCYNYDKYAAPNCTTGTDLTPNEALETVRKIADFGFEQIHFLGGEPLFRKDILEIFAEAVKRGLRVTVNSNGTLITPAMAERLVDVGVQQMAISLDGPEPKSNDEIRGEGTFEKVRRGVECLVQENERRGKPIHIGLVVTLTRPLLERETLLGDFFPLVYNWGIHWLNYIFLYKNSKALTYVDHLAYPMGQALSALEHVIVEMARAYPQISLQLDSRPLYVKYLNLRHGVRAVVSPQGLKCSAGNKTWLLEADGLVHPCGVCSAPDYGLKASEDGLFPFQRINIKDVTAKDEVYHSEYFRSVRRFLSAATNYRKFVTCQDCEFFSCCRPCLFYSPLGPVHNRETCIVEECEWVKERLQQFYTNISSVVPQVSEGVMSETISDGKIRLQYIRGGRECRLSSTAASIWQLIDDQRSVDAIINQLAVFYYLPHDRTAVLTDVADFLCVLRNNRFLKLHQPSSGNTVYRPLLFHQSILRNYVQVFPGQAFAQAGVEADLVDRRLFLGELQEAFEILNIP
ncbi:MAG: PqqD family peptide modification chaperone, partial [Spirochaetota bacterium]